MANKKKGNQAQQPRRKQLLQVSQKVLSAPLTQAVSTRRTGASVVEQVMEVRAGMNEVVLHPSLYPWMETVARGYQSYQMQNLKIWYEPRVSAQTDGTLAMAFLQDFATATPTILPSVIRFSGSTRGPLWSKCSLSAPPSRKYAYLSSGKFQALDPEDKNSRSPGRIVVCADSESNVLLGRVYVSFTPHFEGFADPSESSSTDGGNDAPPPYVAPPVYTKPSKGARNVGWGTHQAKEVGTDTNAFGFADSQFGDTLPGNGLAIQPLSVKVDGKTAIIKGLQNVTGTKILLELQGWFSNSYGKGDDGRRPIMSFVGGSSTVKLDDLDGYQDIEVLSRAEQDQAYRTIGGSTIKRVHWYVVMPPGSGVAARMRPGIVTNTYPYFIYSHRPFVNLVVGSRSTLPSVTEVGEDEAPDPPTEGDSGGAAEVVPQIPVTEKDSYDIQASSYIIDGIEDNRNFPNLADARAYGNVLLNKDVTYVGYVVVSGSYGKAGLPQSYYTVVPKRAAYQYTALTFRSEYGVNAFVRDSYGPGSPVYTSTGSA